jgi:NAD+ synthase (glutamine-hydrolysing)
VRIGILQTNPIIGDLDHNIQNIFDYIDSGLKKGVHFFVTPELGLIGYPPKDFLSLNFLFKKQNQKIESIIEQSRVKNFSIVLGCITKNKTPGKPFFNTALVISQGQILGEYHKQRIPSYDVFEDERFFEPGPQINPIFKIDNFRFKLAICEDVWSQTQGFGIRDIRGYPKKTHPFLIDQAPKENIDAFIHIAASPYWTSKIETRRDLFSALAQKTQCPILTVNSCGAQDELIFDGTSFMVSRSGDLSFVAPSFLEGLYLCDTDQMKITSLPKTEHWNDVFLALSLGIRDYVHKTGFEKVHLGISGGIDSALVAALCCHALGSHNVNGYLLPSEFTSEASNTDGQKLCENLGIDSQKISISEILKLSRAELAMEDRGLAYENLQSRIRGLLLMGISNKDHSLLISTGNKSEIAMGYATLYGDMCGALSPIGDLYKTEVYALSHYLNQNFQKLGYKKAPIPESVLKRPPTAELAHNQKDQDSLPSYEILDGVLYDLIENQGETQFSVESWNRILAPNHSVDGLLRKISRCEFKRNQGAPILKVHLRSFGKNWRFPIAAGSWELFTNSKDKRK